MNLRLYPMDIQTCPLIIESCEYNVCANDILNWLLACFSYDLFFKEGRGRGRGIVQVKMRRRRDFKMASTNRMTQ